MDNIISINKSNHLNPVISKNLNEEHENEEHEKALSILEKHPHLKEKSLLREKNYFQYQHLCDEITNTKEEEKLPPKASPNGTPVYLPKSMPKIVLKLLYTSIDCIDRFKKMVRVRSYLQENPHLIIPKAYVYKGFIVEKRLPINTDTYHNIELYCFHTKLFNQAVIELTRLFSKVYIDDLLCPSARVETHIRGIKYFVRYDNLPLYIEKKNGKKEGYFGLIDLEDITCLEDIPYPEDVKKHHAKGIEELSRIFPLHLDLIVQEAKKLKMEIKIEPLEKASNQGKLWIKKIFFDHFNWIKCRKITKKITAKLKITPERLKELALLTQRELLKINLGFSKLVENTNPLKNFFKYDPQNTAKELSEIIMEVIFKEVKYQIKEHNQTCLNIFKKLTRAAKVSLRSPVIKADIIYKKILSLLRKHENVEFKKEHGSTEGYRIATEIACFIFKNLEKQELFLFDPVKHIGRDFWWIRY